MGLIVEKSMGEVGSSVRFSAASQAEVRQYAQIFDQLGIVWLGPLRRIWRSGSVRQLEM